jgi:hypothetical protein
MTCFVSAVQATCSFMIAHRMSLTHEAIMYYLCELTVVQVVADVRGRGNARSSHRVC